MKWPPRRSLVVLLCESLRKHRVPGAGRGGWRRAGRSRSRSMLCEGSRHHGFSFGAAFSSGLGRRRGGLSPTAWRRFASRSLEGNGLFFVFFFFFSLLSPPFPAPPFPHRFVRGCEKRSRGGSGAPGGFFSPRLPRTTWPRRGAPCSSGRQRCGQWGWQHSSPAGDEVGGRTKAARIMQAKPWVPINKAARLPPFPPPQPPACLLL